MILYDGSADPKKLVGVNLPDGLRICIQNNGGATFLNYDAARGFKHPSRDLAPHSCSLTSLTAVSLPTAGAGAPGGGS